MTWNQGLIREIVAKRASDLDARKCECGGGCSEWNFEQKCHPDAALVAAYCNKEKVVILACSECNSFVVKIKVAD